MYYVTGGLIAILIASGCGNQTKSEEPLTPEQSPEMTSPPPLSSTSNGDSNPVPVFVKKENLGKVVALSFDDGPDPKWTPKILSILKEKGIHATFFMVGTQAEKYPDIINQMVKEGHDVANHSWNHPNFTKISAEQVKEEIERTNTVIETAGGVKPTLCRAPYGAVNDLVKAVAQAQGCVMVSWSVDTRDWAGDSVDVMMQAVRKQVHPGAIVLEHSFGGKNSDLSNTVALIPEMVRYLEEQGYTFVKVSDLYEIKE